VLVLGVIRGVKAEIPVHYAIGILGGYVLGRTVKLGRGASLLTAVVYMLCGVFCAGLESGMTWLLACAYIPWALAFYFRALASTSGPKCFANAAGGGAALTLMYFDGGAYPLALVALFLGVHATLEAATTATQATRLRRSALGRGRSLVLVAMLLLSALLLGAIKFFPSIAYMAEHPRRAFDVSGFSVCSMLRGVSVAAPPGQTERGPDTRFLGGVTWGGEENATYVGVVAVGLFLIGLATTWRREWKLAVCLALFVWLSLGDTCPISLWRGLRCLPVFSSMRVAQRARLIWVLLAALFAGWGLSWVYHRVASSRLGPAAARALTTVLVLVVVLDLLRVNREAFRHTFPFPPAISKRSGEFYQISKLDDVDSERLLDRLGPLMSRTLSALYPAFLCNVGTIDALESASTRRRALPQNSLRYKGEVFLEGTDGEAVIAYWSPNRVVVEVGAQQRGRVLLNQNHNPGWRAAGGGPAAVEWVNGFVGVQVGPGTQTLVFRYLPWSFLLGAAVSAGTGVFYVLGIARSVRSLPR